MIDEMIRISLIDSSRGVVLKCKIALCRYWIRTKQLLTGGKFKDISNGYLEKGNDFMRLQDYAEAMHWYRKAAEQGNAIAQFNLGVMYSNGKGVKQDQTEAAKWYRLAAAQGNVSALCNLGVMYDGTDVGGQFRSSPRNCWAISIIAKKLLYALRAMWLQERDYVVSANE